MKKTGVDKQPKKKGLDVPLKKLKKDLWGLVSRYVRMSYADKDGFCECYTCDTRRHWKEMQAGHGISGRGNAILFDLRIIRPQCPTCNLGRGGSFMGRGGNYPVFIPKLIKEMGIDVYESLVIGSHKEVKLSRDWYAEQKEFYKGELRIMEACDLADKTF
jgi:hypothetical protein